MKSFARVLGGVLAATLPVVALAQLRVATYNISNYGGFDREHPIQSAFYESFEGRRMAPDVVVCQEFLSPFALSTFVALLNVSPGSPSDWVAAPFVDGADTDSVLAFRSSKLTLVGTSVVAVGSNEPGNHPRNIMRYDMQLVGYSAQAGRFSIYSTHMKAGSAADDQSRRLIEAVRIRDDAENLPPGTPFMIGGDFNISSSSETAYSELVGSQLNNAGRFFDPIKSPGSWGSQAFRFVHTQDPVGSGGMDDRYDQILLSAGLVNGLGFEYLGDPSMPYSTTMWNDPNHSYRSWGNDGSSYNAQLTTTGNSMVGPQIAASLRSVAASGGHLPVFLDLKVPPKVWRSPSVLEFGKVFRTFKPPQRSFNVSNVGNTTLWGPSGVANLVYNVSVSGDFFSLPGPFSVAAGGAPLQHIVSMNTRTSGLKSGVLTISSDDPEVPVITILLSGYVVAFNGR